MKGIIAKVSGPTVVAKNMKTSKMYNLVYVGRERLIGEVIRIEGDLATIQVYEETDGLTLGDEVIDTGGPLCAELGPGLISSIFDGIQRPLTEIMRHRGIYIPASISVPYLDRSRKWHFTPLVKRGEKVKGGDIIGIIPETLSIVHKVMVPPDMEGVIKDTGEGFFTVDDTVAILDDGREIKLFHKWPVRKPRPFKKKLSSRIPFITGQRVIDTLFPIPLGGCVIIPGGFGTGKTVLEHTIAKFAKVDIIIYIGCGERGNEIAEVLEAFPELKDPHTGYPLMERTILVVNTSNMPVAAREASIYTGITIGGYYRDMGYDVAILADSISRWAEAMREISARMEELPGEEGFPMYLASRLASFYERSGMVECLGRDGRTGSITVCTAISPPGGDFSEPVTQSALRVTGAMWALDTELARRRHFPAINWSRSFTLYHLDEWFERHVAEDWPSLRAELTGLLEKEEELMDIVRLVGPDALQDRERAVIETGHIIRENFLQQSPFHPVDAFCPLEKQYWMIKIFLSFYKTGLKQLEKGLAIKDIFTEERKLLLKDLRNKEWTTIRDKIEEILEKLGIEEG